MLSQDLLNASLQIPFSVPPYMSLLARAVATLEGIALSGNPDYQMVAEVHSPVQKTAPHHLSMLPRCAACNRQAPPCSAAMEGAGALQPCQAHRLDSGLTLT